MAFEGYGDLHEVADEPMYCIEIAHPNAGTEVRHYSNEDDFWADKAVLDASYAAYFVVVGP